MAFTQSDLDAVNAAIASGELTVEVSGRRITYRSMADLERARAIIQGDMAAQSPAGATRRGSFQVRFSTARDY